MPNSTGVLSRRPVEPGKQENAEVQPEETAPAQVLTATAQAQRITVPQELVTAAAQELLQHRNQ